MLNQYGCNSFMLTLHGNEPHHNEIAQNSNAFSAINSFSDWITDQGFWINYNIMLNRYVVSDWEEIAALVNSKRNFSCRLTIPMFLPTRRLRSFQAYRAQYNDCIKLYGRLSQLGISEDKYRTLVECGNEKYIFLLTENGWDFVQKNEDQPQWAFFNITQSLDLFYGNAGLHTKYLGNLKNMGTEELADIIRVQTANYDYSAYYDLRVLPRIEQIRKVVSDSKTNYVYPDTESCLYSWLDYYGVNTDLLDSFN